MFLKKISKFPEVFKGKSLSFSPFPFFSFTKFLPSAFDPSKNQSFQNCSLTHTQAFGFKFIGLPKRKGMRAYKHRSKKNSPKKRGLIKLKPLHRVSNHNGLLKRVKIVGPRWDRRFKFRSAGARHLMRNKSKANRLRKRRTRYVEKCDMEKMRKMIPYYKRKKTKDLH